MKCKLTMLRARGSGGLSSPFDSSVEGLSLPNAHWVDDDDTLLRGMEPRTPEQFEELRELGISKVLIFKNATGQDEVDDEIAEWALPEGDVLHVPFNRQMAFLVSEGLLTEELEEAVCAQEPEVPAEFLSASLTCGTSTTLVP